MPDSRAVQPLSNIPLLNAINLFKCQTIIELHLKFQVKIIQMKLKMILTVTHEILFGYANFLCITC